MTSTLLASTLMQAAWPKPKSYYIEYLLLWLSNISAELVSIWGFGAGKEWGYVSHVLCPTPPWLCWKSHRVISPIPAIAV